MLRKLQEHEFDALAEMAYALSQDLSKTSFPLYTDGVKTKADFLNANRLHRKDHEILVYERDGEIQGWVHYYTLPEDKCVCLSNMSIREGYAHAFLEALDYWRERFPGYTWGFYFSEDDAEMMALAKKEGYTVCPREYADILLLRDYEIQNISGQVEKVTRETFSLFREVHKIRDDEMYWTNDRIEKDLDNWAIYAYIHEGRYVGTVYYDGYGTKDLEIFGMDFLPGYDKPEIARDLLAACLNGAKDAGAGSMYHWPDTQRDQEIALSLGFHCLTAARCIKGRL